jgi:hypothetical protein
MNTWACAEANGTLRSTAAVSGATSVTAGKGWQAPAGSRDSKAVTIWSACARFTAPTTLTFARQGCTTR